MFVRTKCWTPRPSQICSESQTTSAALWPAWQVNYVSASLIAAKFKLQKSNKIIHKHLEVFWHFPGHLFVFHSSSWQQVSSAESSLRSSKLDVQVRLRGPCRHAVQTHGRHLPSLHTKCRDEATRLLWVISRNATGFYLVNFTSVIVSRRACEL